MAALRQRLYSYLSNFQRGQMVDLLLSLVELGATPALQFTLLQMFVVGISFVLPTLYAWCGGVGPALAPRTGSWLSSAGMTLITLLYVGLASALHYGTMVGIFFHNWGVLGRVISFTMYSFVIAVWYISFESAGASCSLLDICLLLVSLLPHPRLFLSFVFFMYTTSLIPSVVMWLHSRLARGASAAPSSWLGVSALDALLFALHAFASLHVWFRAQDMSATLARHAEAHAWCTADTQLSPRIAAALHGVLILLLLVFVGVRLLRAAELLISKAITLIGFQYMSKPEGRESVMMLMRAAPSPLARSIATFVSRVRMLPTDLASALRVADNRTPLEGLLMRAVRVLQTGAATWARARDVLTHGLHAMRYRSHGVTLRTLVVMRATKGVLDPSFADLSGVQLRLVSYTRRTAYGCIPLPKLMWKRRPLASLSLPLLPQDVEHRPLQSWTSSDEFVMPVYVSARVYTAALCRALRRFELAVHTPTAQQLSPWWRAIMLLDADAVQRLVRMLTGSDVADLLALPGVTMAEATHLLQRSSVRSEAPSPADDVLDLLGDVPDVDDDCSVAAEDEARDPFEVDADDTLAPSFAAIRAAGLLSFLERGQQLHFSLTDVMRALLPQADRVLHRWRHIPWGLAMDGALSHARDAIRQLLPALASDVGTGMRNLNEAIVGGASAIVLRLSSQMRPHVQARARVGSTLLSALWQQRAERMWPAVALPLTQLFAKLCGARGDTRGGTRPRAPRSMVSRFLGLLQHREDADGSGAHVEMELVLRSTECAIRLPLLIASPTHYDGLLVRNAVLHKCMDSFASGLEGLRASQCCMHRLEPFVMPRLRGNVHVTAALDAVVTALTRPPWMSLELARVVGVVQDGRAGRCADAAHSNMRVPNSWKSITSLVMAQYVDAVDALASIFSAENESQEWELSGATVAAASPPRDGAQDEGGVAASVAAEGTGAMRVAAETGAEGGGAATPHERSWYTQLIAQLTAMAERARHAPQSLEELVSRWKGTHALWSFCVLVFAHHVLLTMVVLHDCVAEMADEGAPLSPPPPPPPPTLGGAPQATRRHALPRQAQEGGPPAWEIAPNAAHRFQLVRTECIAGGEVTAHVERRAAEPTIAELAATALILPILAIQPPSYTAPHG